MRLQIGIIGLGKFGMKLGQSLVGLGQEVLGLDNDPEKIKHAQTLLTQVYQMDATDREALQQVRIQDLEYVLISVGDSIAASVMISLYLKELEVKKVWAKAINWDHQKVLYKIGVDQVIIPEFMAAKEIANRITTPGFIEYLPFDKSMAIREFTIDEWAGKSLRQLDLTNTSNIQVIAIRSKSEIRYHFIPKADEVLEGGDVIVAIGKITELDDIKS